MSLVSRFEVEACREIDLDAGQAIHEVTCS